ncbi:MAG: roadblock/LC7 domain-containing protein [candidate division NC10 bacterium]|nr:roadblock/LC7 domain-containing protein [candidate division NC10 bacterium]
MDFRQYLASVVEKVEGAVMTILFDPDGMVVALFPETSPFDAEGLAARYAFLFRELILASTRAGQGEIRTILMELENASVVALPLKEGYVLSLILKPGGNVGRGIFEVKKAAFFLEKGL